MTEQIETLHLNEVLEKHSQDMTGKVVAITGTTSGTGYVAAREIARRGAEVLLLNRESNRSKESLEKLKEEVSEGNFVQINCDLQSKDSVDNAISEIKSRYEVLDVLVNNAGVMALEDKATDDGYDVQMQTNVLSHFQLFRGLFPLMKNSKEARVVNHSSMARLGGPLEPRYFGKNGGNLGGDEPDPDSESGFSGGRWQRYHQTKLANFVFTYILNEKLKEHNISNVISLVAHPGLAKTSLQVTTAKDGGMDAKSDFMKQAQSAEDGATGIIRAAMDPEAKPGDFFGPREWTGYPDRLEPEEDLISEKNREIFWKGCEEAIGSIDFE